MLETKIFSIFIPCQLYRNQGAKFLGKSINCRLSVDNLTTFSTRNFHRNVGSISRVFFIGSDQFSLPSLEAVQKVFSTSQVTVVVTNIKNPVGQLAQKKCLRTVLWGELKDDAKRLENTGEWLGDVGIVASFGALIPSRVINKFRCGILNVHASLLPRWRGASPIPYCLMKGDSTTGISIMKIAPYKFDVGPVLLQKSISIDPHVRAPELTQRLANIGAEALTTVISDLDHYLKNPLPQTEIGVTHAPKLSPEDSEVEWDKMSSLEVYNLFRGLYGTYKLRTWFNSKPLDLDDLRLIQTKSHNCNKNSSEVSNRITDSDYKDRLPVIVATSLPCDVEDYPGRLFFTQGLLCVKCVENNKLPYLPWVAVTKIKVTNKWISAKDFYNGYLSKKKIKSDKIQYFYRDKSKSLSDNLVKNKINVH